MRIAQTNELENQFEQEIAEFHDQNRRTLATKLLTMDAFLDDVTPLLESGDLPKCVTAMVSFDGDGMSKKNEEFGNGTGNRLSMAFADTTKRHFPDSDLKQMRRSGR